MFKAQVPDELDTNDLFEIAAKAQQAFAATSTNGFVSKAIVAATGLTANECRQAAKVEWKRLIEKAIRPGQTVRERRKAMDLAAGNGAIPLRVAIWEALAALLDGDDAETGRLQMGNQTTTSGSYRTVVVHSRLDIREGIAALPILMLDATLPLSIVQRFLPRTQVLADIQPVAPHMRVVQVTGGFGITTLVAPKTDKIGDAEKQRRRNMVAELADFAGLHSQGDAAVLTYQDIETAFQRPGIRTGHFGALVGLNAYKDVRAGFVIGRPLPNPEDARQMTLALTGRVVPEDGGQTETRGLLMEDGTGSPMACRTYADPDMEADMEAIRAAITDAGIVQAVGRFRGLRRTAANPVTVFVFADVTTSLPIHRVVRWDDIRLDVLQRMAARGLVLTSPTDAAFIYPDLSPTAEAARKALARTTGQTPIGSTSIGKCPVVPPEDPIGGCSPVAWVQATYQPHGKAQKTRKAWVTPDRLDGLAEWLTERLGVPVRLLTPPQPQPAEVPVPQPRQPLWQEPAVTGLFRVGSDKLIELDGRMLFRVMPARPSPEQVAA